jgi:hypothetical protein
MAIWTLAPSMETPPAIAFGAPPVLITRLDDGKEISRRKHANASRTWSETYRATGAEFDAALAIFVAYGTDLPLTKKSYATASAPNTEANVCFNSFDLQRQGEDFFEFSVTWRLVV